MYSQYVECIDGKTPSLMYLPLYKLSQDHIERLFGYVRSRGGHNNNPSSREITGSFKRILLHRELQETNTGNALILNKTYILALKKKRNEVGEINSSTPGWRSLEENDGDADHIMNNEEESDDVVLSLLENTSNVHINIVEYIGGFLVQSLRKEIVCTSCIDLLMADATNKYSLVHAKNRGGLLQPSEGVVKLCLLADTVVKYHIQRGDITSVKNLVDVMIMSVMRKCVDVNIFPGDHCFEQEPEQNHLILLMKAICRKYFKIRLHHYSKTLSDTLHKAKLRRHLLKTVTFMGQ